MKVTPKPSNTAANVDSAKSAKPGADALKDLGTKKVSTAALSDSSKVAVSEKAQSIKKAKELATPDDTIDEAKVARLQKMIDEGTYKVDAGAVADKLVDEHMMIPS